MDNNFIKEYVSKKQFDAFFSKYRIFLKSIDKNRNLLTDDMFLTLQRISKLSYDSFRIHNKKYIEKSLSNYKEYFDNYKQRKCEKEKKNLHDYIKKVRLLNSSNSSYFFFSHSFFNNSIFNIIYTYF